MRELIDRAALIVEYDKVHIGPPGAARKLIENAPVIEERQTGKWILSDDRYWKTCSECGAYVDVSMGLGIYDVNNDEVGEMRFCPNCGAYMRDKETAE